MHSLTAIFFPHISASVQILFRTVYGILLLATLGTILPNARHFFVSKRWGGYAESQIGVDLIQNPYVLPVVLGIWILCGIGLVSGHWVVAAAFINLVICWYFFVWMRWRGVLRGMGAPGLITYWLAMAVFLTEYASRYAHHLLPLVLLVLQWDFALIIFSSGFYKFKSGYRQNEGVEIGLVNPEWGYWWRFYKRFPAEHRVFKIFNQVAWSSQILTSILMLIPQTRFLGGLLLIATFVLILPNIRLGFLCEMVMTCGVVFFGIGTLGDSFVKHWIAVPESFMSPAPTICIAANTILGVLLTAYIFLLPLAHAGLFYNFYARKTFPPFSQKLLEKYTNFFGMIIWRVFSIDVINFFIQIYRAPSERPLQRTLISEWGNLANVRYNSVAESITVTSVFTTLKYYASRPEIFRDRLLRYARTIPHSEQEILIFEYVFITKDRGRFAFHPASEFIVDTGKNLVTHQILDSKFSVHHIPQVSPVHEAVIPGSYRPVVD